MSKVFTMFRAISLLVVVNILSYAWFGALEAAPLLDSREYKVLIKAERFTDRAQGFNEYWEKIKTIATEFGFRVKDAESCSEEIKQVTFLDTDALDLSKQGYILRVRRSMQGNALAPTYELTLKYRVPDLSKISAASIETAKSYKSSVKMQEDYVGFQKSEIGLNASEMSLSHTIKKLSEKKLNTVGDAAVFFPTLACLNIDSATPINAPNGLIVKEYKVSPGLIDFGGTSAEVDLTAWARFQDESLIIGEISFEVELGEKVSSDTVANYARFFEKIQEVMKQDLVPGQAKTQFIYAPKNL